MGNKYKGLADYRPDGEYLPDWNTKIGPCRSGGGSRFTTKHHIFQTLKDVHHDPYNSQNVHKMNKSSRNPTRPKFSYKKRLDISEDMHGRIDMLLKDLRSCAQRLAPLLSALEDEMRILERLYYKGRNQHRSALFWRKVEEMRRYGKRILELQSFEQVDSLRYSFYVGDDAVRQ